MPEPRMQAIRTRRLRRSSVELASTATLATLRSAAPSVGAPSWALLPTLVGLGRNPGKVPPVGGLARCVECGEVHWNLSLGSRSEASHQCRLCGSEMKPERRRPGRRFDRLVPERRDAPLPGNTLRPQA